MSPASRPRGVSRNVLLLGVASLLGDVASEMVVPLLPAFLVALGGSAEALGIIEGVADAIANVFKYVSGRWADRARRLLPLAVLGYAIAGLVRPLLALARAPWHVFAVRCTDRIGKGIRTSPRDKLLAASADPTRLAEAFAFHRGMDHFGAAVGPLVAAALLLEWPERFPLVFALAAIPGALAIGVLFLVRETPAASSTRSGPDAAKSVEVETPGTPQARAKAAANSRGIEQGVPEIRRLLFAIFVFTLGNSTDTLLLLRAQGLGVKTALLPVLWTLLHVVRATTSWPLGSAADRFGRLRTLRAGWLWYALCYAGFAAADTAWQAWPLFAAYGLVAGLTEGTERALIAASAQERERGRALGTYNLISGAGLLLASLGAGVLWENVSPAAALGVGAGLSTVAAILLQSRAGARQVG